MTGAGDMSIATFIEQTDSSAANVGSTLTATALECAYVCWNFTGCVAFTFDQAGTALDLAV